MVEAPADQIDADDNWIGGHYQLALELGSRDDARLETAFNALIGLTGMEGAWVLTSVNPSAIETAELNVASTVQFGLIRGQIRLPTGERVVCAVHVVREEAEPSFYAPDWVVFDLPLGALIKVEPRIGGYPFGDTAGSLGWRTRLDDWMVGIARPLFVQVAFRLGLVGMECSGDAYSDRLADGVPERRPFGYLVPGGAGLTYFPATA
jgi:hypothetical protein